jgi:hypothetical protein
VASASSRRSVLSALKARNGEANEFSGHQFVGALTTAGGDKAFADLKEGAASNKRMSLGSKYCTTLRRA